MMCSDVSLCAVCSSELKGAASLHSVESMYCSNCIGEVGLDEVFIIFAKRYSMGEFRKSRVFSNSLRILELARSGLDMFFREETQLFDYDPGFLAIYDVYGRCHRLISSTMNSILRDDFASAEILARASTETCVNALYLLKGDRTENVVSYFNHHLAAKKNNINKWEESLASDDSSQYQKFMRRKIKKAREDVALYKRLLVDAFSMDGVDFKTYKAWPNHHDRFKAVGFATHYRTVYSALSNQVHGDAEDTINRFIEAVLHPDIAKKVKVVRSAESVTFAYLMALGTVQLFVTLTLAYMNAYISEEERACGSKWSVFFEDLLVQAEGNSELINMAHDQVKDLGS